MLPKGSGFVKRQDHTWLCGVCLKPASQKVDAWNCCPQEKQPELYGDAPYKPKHSPTPRSGRDNIHRPGAGGHWFRGKKPSLKKDTADYNKAQAQIERILRADAKKWNEYYETWFYPQQVNRTRCATPLQRLGYAFHLQDWDMIRAAAYNLAHIEAETMFRRRMQEVLDDITAVDEADFNEELDAHDIDPPGTN